MRTIVSGAVSMSLPLARSPPDCSVGSKRATGSSRRIGGVPTRSRGGQQHREAAAPSRALALGTNAAPVELDEALGEREPDAQAGLGARAQAGTLDERLED